MIQIAVDNLSHIVGDESLDAFLSKSESSWLLAAQTVAMPFGEFAASVCIRIFVPPVARKYSRRADVISAYGGQK
jgi:hypothetical protein